MLDKFRNLSDKGKMIVAGIALVVFVAVFVIASALIKGSDTPEPVPTIDPSPSQSSAAPETVEPTPEVTNTAPAPSPSATINYGETTLSIEEERNAQNTAKSAALEYMKTEKSDTPETKNARLSQYFDPSVDVFNENSLATSLGLEKVDANNFAISLGTVDYIDPVGGTEQEYKVVVGTTLKVQFNQEGKAPQILESNQNYVFLLSKASGSWKVTSLIES